jgi:archaellum component FlaC
MTNKEMAVNALIQSSEEIGLVPTLNAVFGKTVKVKIPFTKRACEAPIDDIEFSPRANNSMKRAGVFTVGEVIDLIANDELSHIRNLGKKTENEIPSFKKKCSRDFKKKLHKALSEKTAELEANYKTLAEQLELDYTNACEEVKNELFQQLSDVDIALEEHAKKMAAKNILTFSCVCSRDLIPCAIDFTKENTFVCPRCQSKYKVAINANPVLIGKNISDEEFAELVEKRLNENKKTN